jgi:tRNA(Ile)-lysidine synthase
MRVHGEGKPDKREFEELPVAVQRQIIQMQLMSKGIKSEFELVEWLRTQPEKAIEVNAENGGRRGALELVKAAARRSRVLPIRLIRKGASVETLEPLPDFQRGSRKLNLRTAGTVNWHGVKFSWRTRAIATVKPLKGSPGSEFFDADAVGAGAKLRHWRAGDRFQPIGMKRAIKLQDLFVNQKLDCGQRRRLVVGTTAHGEIFWVEGLRISERFKLTDQTIRRLHWAWQRL